MIFKLEISMFVIMVIMFVLCSYVKVYDNDAAAAIIAGKSH